MTLIKGTTSKTLLADRKTKPNADAMRKAAKVLGVEAPKARGAKADADLLAALREEVGKRLAQISEDDHVKCTVCGEIATDDTEFCPFCGDEGGTPEEAAKLPKPTAPVVAEDEEEEWPEDMNSEGEGDDDADAEEGDDEDESDDDEDESDDDEPEEEGDAVAVEEDAEDDGVGIAARATVTKNVPAAMKGLATELDKAVERIVQLKRSAVGLSYDIGLVCREIRDKQLFKARGYKSFKEFADKELPFTRESALQLVSIVEKHTRQNYEELGYAKMRVISTVSDAGAQEELIAAAREGATTKQLKEQAVAVSSHTRGKAAAGKAAAPAPEKGERVTLLGKVNGAKKVVKFINSETGEQIANAGVFTKKSFVPSAYAELEISEGVFLRIALRTGANMELEGLTVRFQRSE